MKAELLSMLRERKVKWAGCGVLSFPEIDSTNLYARRLGEEGGAHGTLVVADHQTSGKGRRGRVWDSPAGSDIYMSILLRPELAPDKAPMTTLIMAQSVAEAIGCVAGVTPQIKWPNDLVLNGRKVCGILTEMSAGIDRVNYIVVGVGINVNRTAFPEELANMATSLYLEQGRCIRRAELIAAVLERFEEHYEAFLKAGNLSFLQEAYNVLLVNRGREVRVLAPGNEYSGQAMGIDETGELLVRAEDGTIRKVFAGEVSVRGIYGYV